MQYTHQSDNSSSDIDSGEVNTSEGRLTQTPEETLRYLADFEETHWQELEVKKKADSLILFLACQFGCCSLAWLFFYLQLSLILINMCSLIAVLPGAISLTEGINADIRKDTWQLVLGNSPALALVKVGIGVCTAFVGTQKINKAYSETNIGIQQTYQTIQKIDKGAGFVDSPGFVFAVLLAVVGVGVMTMFGGLMKSGKNRGQGEVEK